MIYQISKAHGKHIAYSQQEADANEKAGWRTVTKAVWMSFKPGKDEIFDGDIKEQYKEKFGKYPHHKMKDETIKAALNAE